MPRHPPARPALIGSLVLAGLGWSAGAARPAPAAGSGSQGGVGAAPEPGPPAVGEESAGQDGWRVEGAYGLYVGLMPDGIDVRWLTRRPLPGIVRAMAGGRVLQEKATQPGYAHAARLQVDAPVVTLEYGADRPGGLHRTEVRLAAPPKAEVDLPAPDSLFVFGDVHGEFSRVAALLRRAGVIGEDLRWTGGRATVALLGDLFDRGDDVTRLLWFVYELEREAAAAGGRVITLLGNHEVMVMSGDVRYVAPKELAISDGHGMSYPELFAPSSSVLGRWLAAKPGLVRLGDLLLAHGGVSPAYRDVELDVFRDTLRTYISEPLFTAWHDQERFDLLVPKTPLDPASLRRRYDFFFDPQSVFWYRDLVLTDTLGTHLADVLSRFDAAAHVVGHTPVRTIRELYDGRLIAADLLNAASEMLVLEARPEGGWTGLRMPLEGEPLPLGSGRSGVAARSPRDEARRR